MCSITASTNAIFGKNLALSLANVVAGDVEYTGDNASTANLLQQIRKKRL